MIGYDSAPLSFDADHVQRHAEQRRQRRAKERQQLQRAGSGHGGCQGISAAGLRQYFKFKISKA